MNPRSLVFRLGAWYTLLLSITFALVSAASFYGLQHYLRANLKDSLKHRSVQIEQILKALPKDASASMIGREIEDRLAPEVNNRFVRITRGSGTTIYRSGAPLRPQLRSIRRASQILVRTHSGCGPAGRDFDGSTSDDRHDARDRALGNISSGSRCLD